MKKRFSLILFVIVSNVVAAQSVFSGESIEYDTTGHRFFTSSDATSIIQRAANGALSYFGTGLTADYGMEIMGNTLFAVTGSSVKGYDLTTELMVMDAPVPGATFLNGLTNDGNGNLYVTDYGSHKIYKIDASNLVTPVVTTIVPNTITAPNGIVYDGASNRLIFVNWGSNALIKAVDLSNNSVSTLATTTVGNLDGIDDDAYGHYYVSSWTPARITRFDASFTGTPVTITAPGLSSPADIGYAKPIDTLAVPNGNNTVTFIGFNTVGIKETGKSDFNLSLSPNPVTQNSYFSFKLDKAAQVVLKIFNAEGKETATLVNEKLNAGKHYVLLNGVVLTKGNYAYSFTVNDKVITGKFVRL